VGRGEQSTVLATVRDDYH